MDNEVNINTDEMDTIISDMNKRLSIIKEIFENTNKDMDWVKDHEYWTGRTSETVFEKYEGLRQSYDSIISSLNTLNGFIDEVKNSYIEFDETISKNVEKSDLSM